MFNYRDKVLCVDDRYVRTLTKGREYTINKVERNFVWIVNDSHMNVKYSSNRFILLQTEKEETKMIEEGDLVKVGNGNVVYQVLAIRGTRNSAILKHTQTDALYEKDLDTLTIARQTPIIGVKFINGHNTSKVYHFYLDLKFGHGMKKGDLLWAEDYDNFVKVINIWFSTTDGYSMATSWATKEFKGKKVNLSPLLTG